MARAKKTGRAANLQLVKMSNLSLVFGLIHQHEKISRAELAHITGLSPTTVSALVDELIIDAMILEVGIGETTVSGRKPIMLEINPSGGYVFGIELTAEGFSVALFNLKGNCVEEITQNIEDYDMLCNILLDVIESTTQAYFEDDKKLLGICIGVPGVIDKAAERVISSTVIPISGCNDFFNAVRRRYPYIPVKMGNESCFCAYSEKVALERDVHSLIYIDIDVGIGAGIILDDKIFTGAFGNAGELGHVSIDYNGPQCKCGNRGCLETLANVPVIKEQIQSRLEIGSYESKLTGENLSLSLIKQALEAGDKLAQEVVSEICMRLAVGINNMINMMNPEAIILGGKITELGDEFLRILRKKIEKVSFAPNIKKLIIAYSAVSGNAVTRGGARYLLDGIFQTSGFWIE